MRQPVDIQAARGDHAAALETYLGTYARKGLVALELPYMQLDPQVPAEAELIRVVCATLDCPLPPILVFKNVQ